MDQAPGWRTDPENEAVERYWDGSAWTDYVRPAGKGIVMRVPGHVPELQRALAAATFDIDAVEDRLSALFDRTGSPAGTGRRDKREGEDEQQGCELYLDFEVDEDDVTLNGAGQDHGATVSSGIDHLAADLDESFADLDAALAAEEPDDDRPGPSPARKKGLFRRRS
jgi:hypothetical protein